MRAMLWRVSAGKRSRRLPPGFIQPCLASEATKPPSGPGWVHEIKHDGYRMQVRKAGDRVRLFTRRGFDWTERYPRIVKAALKIKGDFVMDGECVCIGENGVSDYAKLHARCFDGEAILYAFDLLEMNGESLRLKPLGERKDALRALTRRPTGIYLVDHDDGDGAALFDAACRMGLEGLVSKRLDSLYRPGPKRTKMWVKVKNRLAPGFLRVRDDLDG